MCLLSQPHIEMTFHVSHVTLYMTGYKPHFDHIRSPDAMVNVRSAVKIILTIFDYSRDPLIHISKQCLTFFMRFICEGLLLFSHLHHLFAFMFRFFSLCAAFFLSRSSSVTFFLSFHSHALPFFHFLSFFFFFPSLLSVSIYFTSLSLGLYEYITDSFFLTIFFYIFVFFLPCSLSSTLSISPSISFFVRRFPHFR